jgi:hypothetical protein
MTKINQHGNIPQGAPPVQHKSGSMRSTPAGGKVSPDQYVGKAPAPAPTPAPKL